MKQIICASILSFFIFGCASDPSNISAQYVSPVQYQSYDCAQLGMEAQRVNSRVGELYRRTKAIADNDAAQMGVGLLLFWPTLFFLEGGDGPEAAEYARLKGESEAIDKSAIAKRCGSLASHDSVTKRHGS